MNLINRAARVRCHGLGLTVLIQTNRDALQSALKQREPNLISKQINE